MDVQDRVSCLEFHKGSSNTQMALTELYSLISYL